MFQVLDSLEDVFEKQGVNFPISYDSYYRMILAEIPQNSLAEAMESLKMIASKSSTQINFDYAIISLYKSLKNSIKNIVYGNKIIKNQFHLSLNKKESFMFFGNVLESNKVSSPQQCIKFCVPVHILCTSTVHQFNPSTRLVAGKKQRSA